MVIEQRITFGAYETWCRITGDLSNPDGPAPVVILHGGPGVGHNYVLPMQDLSRDGRAVIHYDQIGCGNSTHRPDAPVDFWTPELFVEEFHNLINTLGIADRYHIVGQSWGGMLAAEIAVRRPEGLLSAAICNSPASMALWSQAATELRSAMPADVQTALNEHEAAGTTDSPEYLAATQVFYEKHVCRVVPFPDYVNDSFAQMEAEPTVYHTMNGPNEFFVIGTLREWDIRDRLPDIAVPTLVVAGEFDEAAPITWAPFVELIPDVRSHVFAGASHLSHVENPIEFLDVVGQFLAAHE